METARAPLPPAKPSSSDALSVLQRLPDDVLFGIFAFCNGNDLLEFSKVNRAFRATSHDDYLWKVLFKKRFGYSPEPHLRKYRSQYTGNERTILSIADECEIAHDRLPHWDKVNDPRSVFGRVALLHAVSWLHVWGSLKGVHTGKYRVIWRLSVMPRAQYVFDISFRAKTQLKRMVESHLPQNSRLLEFGSDYFDFVLPDLLEVTEPFEDVHVECKCTSQDWKTNIALCSVRLEPVGGSSTREQQSRWERQLARMGKDGRGGLRLLRLRNLRSRPGASYRPWQPWTAFRWYESVFVAAFFMLVAVVFALLLLSRTK
ncbi:hypothetical protein LPJ66_002871 [Kickxella alabastrina]|uniref:Uncharacterized protein n=1 Tax=Kickxella alabastrina TaxID=61397 RepID=A0ACC1IPB1_9FUNG|nr:hypothetical protein LPJ66_002871 [Kickxella alabastrina]